MDVYSLSDDELIEQLKLYNVEYGPILASTRRVYQKKLMRVMEGDVPDSQTSSRADTLPVDELDIDEYEEEEPEPEPIVRETRTTQRKETVRQRIVEDPEPIRRSTPQKVPRDDLSSHTRDDRPISSHIRDERPTSSYTRASRYTASSTTTSTSVPLARPPLTKPSDIITQAKQDKPKKTGLSIWIQILIVIIVAFLIFMVFQNMEPNKTPIRSIEHEP